MRCAVRLRAGSSAVTEPRPGNDRRRTNRAPMPSESEVAPARAPAELFDVLWRLHFELMRAGSVDAAYHTLAAALHCAEAIGSLGLIGGVENITTLHQEEVDALDPPHPRSTREAAARGTFALFTSLHATARAMRARMAATRAIEGHRRAQDDDAAPAEGADEDTQD
jgi:hypothetical protein